MRTLQYVLYNVDTMTVASRHGAGIARVACMYAGCAKTLFDMFTAHAGPTAEHQRVDLTVG